jgi:hypothetical protein
MSSSTPSTHEVLRIRECTPSLFSSVVFTFEFTFEFFKECEGCMNMAFKYNQTNKKCLGMHDIIMNFQNPLESIPNSKVESQNILGLRFKISKFIWIKWYLYHCKSFLKTTIWWAKIVQINFIAQSYNHLKNCDGRGKFNSCSFNMWIGETNDVRLKTLVWSLKAWLHGYKIEH